MPFKIEYDREACIGCGACVAQCSDNWELKQDDEFKAHPKKLEIKELGCNKEAEEVCPVSCIKIIKIK